MNGIYLKLFVDCLEKYQKLNDAEFGRLVRAALAYKATGEEAKLMGREELLWDGMKLDIDRDNESYSKTILARSEAGKKGAEKRWQNDGKNGKCHLPYGKNGQDKDKDKDKDYSSPHIPPQGETGFSPALQSALESWLEYKREKRQAYRPKGLQALVTQIRKSAETYGDSEVAALIGLSMASNWQGIAFDRLGQQNRRKEEHGGGQRNSGEDAKRKWDIKYDVDGDSV